MRSQVLSGLLVSVALTSAGVRAEDWPQWRGPGRDGVAPGARMPAVWPKDPPKPLWRRLVGEGQGAPAVAGGKVYVLGRGTGGQENCYALDAGTGAVAWKVGYDAPYRPADPSAGVGPKSTPTVDGDRVYMLGVSGRFHCFRAGGTVLWKHNFLDEYWGEAKDKDGDDAWWPCCGAASSPLLDGARVVVSVGGRKAGAFTAFDRQKGTVVWRSLGDRSSYGSPVLATLAGQRQVIGFTGLRMVGVSGVDGKLLWEHPFPAQYEQTVLTPVVWKDLVVFGGEKKPTVALRVGNRGGKVTATLAWTAPDLTCYLSSPVAFKDHLVGLDQRGQLVCVDLATGKKTWAGGAYGNYASIVLAGDNLLVLTKDRDLHVLAADPNRRVTRATWKVGSSGDTWSHLAVSGSRLYLKDGTAVFCYDVGGGK